MMADAVKRSQTICLIDHSAAHDSAMLKGVDRGGEVSSVISFVSTAPSTGAVVSRWNTF